MFTTAQFIDDCRNALAMSEPTVAVNRILAEAIKDPGAIDAAIGPGDPSENESAQYHFLHQSPELTIMRVIMPEHLQSPPHNHLVWAVIGMYRGGENNVFYRRNGERIEESGRHNLSAPEVMELAADIIHGISNPLDRRSYALHVYGGSLANPARSLWNPFTLREEPFQLPAMLQYEREMMVRRLEHNAI
jgi:predicted metal-dependent enzyme (double-stranded beta helix superfamily)